MSWIRLVFLFFAFLVFPITFLLFAQWPLRDLVQAGSRLANDMGQLAFGLYMATAVTAASWAGIHLSCHLPGFHSHSSDVSKPSRWRVWAIGLCVAPWALFILWTYVDPVLQSVSQQERFPDSGNPGFFILRLAVMWMALLVLIHAIWALVSSLMGRRS